MAERFTVSVSPEISKKMDALKQERFYNTSKAAMVSFLLELAFDELEKQKNNKED